MTVSEPGSVSAAPLAIDEALRRILTHTPTLPVERLPVAQTVGCRLAEAIASDIDSPPYDKSTVDGFALRSAKPSTVLLSYGGESMSLAIASASRQPTVCATGRRSTGSVGV